MSDSVYEGLWDACLSCREKCCAMSLAFPLFITPEEQRRLPETNTVHPCAYYNEEGLCDAHEDRPVDCRLFPFEILKLDGVFQWVVWEVDCLILKAPDYEPYLLQHERDIIPGFSKYLDDYASFRLDEFIDKYDYRVLRPVKLVR